MGQVLDVMERHGLRPPPTITLLSRALLTLEGTLHVIDPGFDLATEGTQLIDDRRVGERRDAGGDDPARGRPRAARRCARCRSTLEALATSSAPGR